MEFCCRNRQQQVAYPADTQWPPCLENDLRNFRNTIREMRRRELRGERGGRSALPSSATCRPPPAPSPGPKRTATAPPQTDPDPSPATAERRRRGWEALASGHLPAQDRFVDDGEIRHLDADPPHRLESSAPVSLSRKSRRVALLVRGSSTPFEKLTEFLHVLPFRRTSSSDTLSSYTAPGADQQTLEIECLPP